MFVPENPVWTGVVPQHAVVPDCPMPAPHQLSDLSDLAPAQLTAAKALVAESARLGIMVEQTRQQQERVADRCSSEQWLDENEREWYMMDEMMRSRPWADGNVKPFQYPYRVSTNEMREAEGPWVGDVKDPPEGRKWTRGEALSDVLVHVRAVPEFPPRCRVILFAPEFGSPESYDRRAWDAITPRDTCDMWLISWQGWSDFDEMIEQVMFKVLSFADGISTVWFGHSMGAVVAYEVLKRFEKHHTPNLPVALVVSGCPAPHLFSAEYRPHERYSWLADLTSESSFDHLTTEQKTILLREFQVVPPISLDESWQTFLDNGIAPPSVQQKYAEAPEERELTSTMKRAILGDLQVLRSYRFNRDLDSKAVMIPVVAISNDEDELVTSSSVEAWAEYTAPGTKFEHCALEDSEDSEVLAEQGHGYALNPTQTILDTVVAASEKYLIVREVDDILPDCGPTDAPIPEEVDCIVVGAGIAGVSAAKSLVETGRSVIVLDRYRAIGGIWMFYANNFSRVNSSEPAYRLVNQEGPGSRPNEDHSPRHDILRDVFTMASKCCYGCFRCNMDVTKVTKLDDGTWEVTAVNVKTGKVSKVRTKVVSLHVNRRIGKRRDVSYPGANHFRGYEVYGYANEVLGLNFWGRRVIVVGAGAFAFENLRTALEHGARHATILGRRAGTTCPKWIDMIAFLRPLDQHYNTNKTGNIISFDAWRSCYENAGLRTPECWDEGLLKPHNHTVSVSDLAFVGGYHKMVDLRVGEIRSFRLDGQGVTLKNGDLVDCDIVIKATGFHLNNDVPRLTGYSKIYSCNLLDFNMEYGAEPLLDGGQFGGLKGKIAMETDGSTPDEADVALGLAEIARLKLPDLTPRANAFGSSYAGGMLSCAYNFKWLVENPDYQKALLQASGTPACSTVEMWASQIGQNSMNTLRKLISQLKRD